MCEACCAATDRVTSFSGSGRALLRRSVILFERNFARCCFMVFAVYRCGPYPTLLDVFEGFTSSCSSA